VVEHLLCKCEILSSNSSLTKKQNKTKHWFPGHFHIFEVNTQKKGKTGSLRRKGWTGLQALFTVRSWGSEWRAKDWWLSAKVPQAFSQVPVTSHLHPHHPGLSAYQNPDL
jgi:hypothetical protein